MIELSVFVRSSIVFRSRVLVSTGGWTLSWEHLKLLTIIAFNIKAYSILKQSQCWTTRATRRNTYSKLTYDKLRIGDSIDSDKQTSSVFSISSRSTELSLAAPASEHPHERGEHQDRART